MLHSDTMKKAKVFLIVIFSLIILVGTGFFLAGYFSPKPGGLRVETNLKASVFVDGTLVGETPFRGSYKAGPVLLRLFPKGSGDSLIPFETSINLVSGIETVVGRNFGTSEASSSGYVISFDKTGGQTAGLIVISQPDNAQVQIDGVSRGFSPYRSTAIAPAKHTITIKSPGYSDLTITVNTIIGYRLTFYGKLASGDPGQVPNQEPQKTEVKTVTISDTPTGYLRVRTAAGQNGEEIAQVKPGDEFAYLGTDTATGWLEIQYEASKSGLPNGITGWVSGQYATVSSEFK